MGVTFFRRVDMGEVENYSFYPNMNDKADAMQQLQEDASTPMLIISCVSGIMMILFGSSLFVHPWEGASIGLILIMSSILSISFVNRHHKIFILLLSLGWVIAIYGGIFLLPNQPVYCLLVIPIIIITLFINRWTGLFAAILINLISYIIARNWSEILPIASWGMGIVLITIVLFVIWIASHIIENIIHWSLISYNRGQEELTRAREYQSELSQAVKDLSDANAQLGRLNQILDASRQQAEEAQRVKTEFAANVSHELRTPLNMIIGFSEAILNAPAMYGVNLPPALLADIAAIYRNSQHLTNLINDVLDISQIEAKRMSLNKEWVAIQEIINEATTAVQPMLSLHGLYLKVRMPEYLPPIYCDRTRIRQVLLNLLSNAGRFTEKGGITIDVAVDERDMTVTVTDTGPGIAESDLAKLFQPFQQLDGSIRRKQGGSGLGLNISKNFIELHNGKMSVRSQPGVGTSFFFSLPLKEELKASNVGRWINPDWSPRRRSRLTPDAHVIPRIIVLENGNFLSSEATRYLDEAEVDLANTPEQAIALLRAGQAQVMLVRGEKTEETQMWLQMLNEERSRTPVVACTLPDRTSRDLLGISGYLMKPISPKLLIESIQSVEKSVRSILLVEDDSDALQLFGRILSAEPHKYRVLQASNGQQALELLRKRKPDLILLDIIMPGMDGFTFLAEKNQSPVLKDIPVIILSATDPNGQPIMIPLIQVARMGGFSIPEFLRSALTLSEELLASRI
jgi:signal transduction histidine kinase/CheY-like chemotaxis protein